MKKGLITKVENNYSLVMTDDMVIERIKKNDNHHIGQRIAFEKEDLYKGFSDIGMRKVVALLVVVMMVTTSFVTFNAYRSEAKVYASVSVDINPSLEMDINRSFIVMDIRTFNEDSEELNLSSLFGMPIDQAIEMILASAEQEGYLEKGNPVLISSVVFEGDSKAIIYNIEAVIDVLHYGESVTYMAARAEEVDIEVDEERDMSIGRQVLMILLGEDQGNIEGMTVAEMLVEADVIKKASIHRNEN